MAEKLIGAAVFGQSGGPTSVINASAYGVIKTALDAPEITKVYGMAHGVAGLLKEELFDLDQEDVEELKYLLNTPSSELGSCRYKIREESELKRIHEVLVKYNIRYFFYNGGNDSMDTCTKINDYLIKVGYDCRVIGVPKTIDNDLYGTDHCPGFGSAAKYIATSVAEVHKDAYVYDTGAITIIEIMGRNAGWLTGASALAELSDAPPDLIYLPEMPFDLDKFLSEVEDVYKKKNKCLVTISEGAQYADGSFVSHAKTSTTDGFGHAQLGGTAATLANIVNKKLGVKVRGIELSLLQRCAAHLASQTDIDEAELAGKSAVEYAISGGTGKMVAFTREEENGKYKCGITYQPLSICANTEKKIPREWINDNGTYVTKEFIDYVLPLIQGENTRKLENGLPRFAKLKKIKV
ncbi:MAG: 6-phosphofructokinase [Oscillospiraceae bacterium]|jgi:6-phosphofructokinase 1|nr:6-phosphofructokinase [Oscillospiraceae bacterium]